MRQSPPVSGNTVTQCDESGSGAESSVNCVVPLRGSAKNAVQISAWDKLTFMQLAAFFLVGCYAVSVQRYLFADGCHFLLTILQTREVMDFYPARYYAHWLTQTPTILLLRSMQTPDAGLASVTFGATLFLVPVIGLLLTWWAARHARRDYLACALVGFSILYLDVSFFVISEIHVAIALFWPMLYLLLFSPRLNFIRSLALIVMAFGAIRTYECYLLLTIPLMWGLVRRCRKGVSQRMHTEVITCILCGLLFLAGFCISIHSTVFPRDPEMRTNFVISGLLHLAYPPVWFSLLTIAGTLWCLFVPGCDRYFKRLFRFTIFCGMISITLPVMGFVIPDLQYMSRIQGLYVPFLLGMALLMATSDSFSTSHSLPSRPIELWRFSTGACVVATAFQLFATLQWSIYRAELLKEIRQRRGVIAFEDSTVGKEFTDRPAVGEERSEIQKRSRSDTHSWIKHLQMKQFNWGWTMPTLSIMLGALNTGAITTIVRAPASTGWQPFDPLQPNEIPDFREYGIPTDTAAE